MIKQYETKQLKLNVPLAGILKGQVIKVKVDKAGTPIERYWRDRLKDAEIDNCVNFVDRKTETKIETKIETKKK